MAAAARACSPMVPPSAQPPVNTTMHAHTTPVSCLQVAEEDLQRVAEASGGQIQTTVNKLSPKALGTCALFEERQVGAERYNLFKGGWLGGWAGGWVGGWLVAGGWVGAKESVLGVGSFGVEEGETGAASACRSAISAAAGSAQQCLFLTCPPHACRPPPPPATGCPSAHTCTLVLRGGSDQFLDEADRSLHDAIMIVRRALKSPLVVPGGGAIDMELSKHLRWGGWARSVCVRCCLLQGWDACCFAVIFRCAHAMLRCQLACLLPALRQTAGWLPCLSLPAGTTRAASPARRSCSSTPLPAPWRSSPASWLTTAALTPQVRQRVVHSVWSVLSFAAGSVVWRGRSVIEVACQGCVRAALACFSSGD